MEHNLIYKDSKSDKFWIIKVEGKSFTVTYGKTGTTGQTQNKKFDSEEKCKKEAEKLLNEKLKKGYVDNNVSISSGKGEKVPVKTATQIDSNKLSEQLMTELEKGEDYSKEKVKSLIRQGADVNYRQRTQFGDIDTPLSLVMDRFDDDTKQTEAAKIIIEAGAKADEKQVSSYLIEQAVFRKNKKLVQYLLSIGVSNGLSESLESAIENNSLEMAGLLLDHGVVLNGSLTFCKTVETANFLLDRGEDPNGISKKDKTPLRSAVLSDRYDLVDLLFQRGAKDVEGTLIEIVDSVEMAKVLIKNGATLKGKSFKFRNWERFFFEKKKPLITFFAENGVDLYVKDDSGETAFHNAIRFNDVKFLEFLLKYYDLKKCHEINDVLKIALNSKVKEFLQSSLGLEGKTTAKKTLEIIVDKNDEVYKQLTKELKSIHTKLTKDKALAEALPKPEEAEAVELINDLLDQIKKNVASWVKAKEPIQCLYFEYNGDVTTPFGSDALFWGYKICDENQKFSKPVLEESGDLDLSAFFNNLDELREEYEKHADNIKTYLERMTFISVHIAFTNAMKNGDLKKLKLKAPFFVFGSEHDNDKTLIYHN